MTFWTVRTGTIPASLVFSGLNCMSGKTGFCRQKPNAAYLTELHSHLSAFARKYYSLVGIVEILQCMYPRLTST